MVEFILPNICCDNFFLRCVQVAQNIEGGWIQSFSNSSYKFPNPKEALADAIDAAGPTLGPTLLSMSEFLMSSFDQSYQSRYVSVTNTFMLCYSFVKVKLNKPCAPDIPAFKYSVPLFFAGRVLMIHITYAFIKLPFCVTSISANLKDAWVEEISAFKVIYDIICFVLPKCTFFLFCGACLTLLSIKELTLF